MSLWVSEMFMVVYSDRFKLHRDPYGIHIESPERLDLALRSCMDKGVIDYSYIYEPRSRPREIVEEVHEPSYVRYVEFLSKRGFSMIDSDTYVNEYTFDVALLAVGACIEGVEMILTNRAKRVFALVRPPGHHVGRAGRALGAITQGFCIFNNIAIATHRVLSYGVKRAAIIDIDVHHGNGTQEIFWYEPRVLHIDIHQQGIYPGTGNLTDIGGKEAEGTKINIALQSGSTDHDYIYVWNEIAEPILEQFKPEFIMISAGFDAYIDEPLSLIHI